MLALSGAAAPATIMWALGYLLFGFFSVFRVVLLADLAAQGGWYLFAGAGLLFGRVGDSLGTALTSGLAASPLVLITVTAVLFACTMALFFALYQQLYVTAPGAVPSEREIFERFAARHDLSSREREVLRLVLAERSNSEIAAELFVSEATVKYHVRNLLRKTGCHNRLEILAKYADH
ncbi:MAG: helix-turn-helix transcriptional regulator [Atopobiaceae bacterium]|nr:helix-turn-helix transcriptional regulator [Atopobiaceae bacterium]